MTIEIVERCLGACVLGARRSRGRRELLRHRPLEGEETTGR